MNSLGLRPRVREDYSINVYRDEADELRWRMVDFVTRAVVGCADEGYAELGEVILNCHTVTGWLPEGFELGAAWDDDASGVYQLHAEALHHACARCGKEDSETANGQALCLACNEGDDG